MHLNIIRIKKMNLTATINPSETVTNSHHIKILYDESLLAQAHLTLDEIEDLEGVLTDMMMLLTKYRRKLQREEI